MDRRKSSLLSPDTATMWKVWNCVCVPTPPPSPLPQSTWAPSYASYQYLPHSPEMQSAARVQLLVEWGREEGVPAVYGNFPMARPWAGSGILIFFFKIHLLLLDTHLSGRGNYTRTMDKKTIIIATTKSQVALYDQLLLPHVHSVFCY